MRRFSQRNSLVTLNEINVTPLLDLAFVLLIIFVITTPALEPSLNLKLPVGGDARSRSDKDNKLTVIGLPSGQYILPAAGGRPLTEQQLEAQLLEAYRRNPQLILELGVEAAAPSQVLVTLLDVCGRNGLTRIKVLTSMPKRR